MCSSHALKVAAEENAAAKKAYDEAAAANAAPVAAGGEQPGMVAWGEGGADEADSEALHHGSAL